MMKWNVAVVASVLAGSMLTVEAQDFEWAGSYGGAGEDVVRDLYVDANGFSYSTGYFTNKADFDIGPDTAGIKSNGFFDVFVQKVDANGNLRWAKGLGGTGFDYGTGIHADQAGNVYVTGVFEDVMDYAPDGVPTQLVSNGAQDIFVIKLNKFGNFEWGVNLGGPEYDEAVGVRADAQGNVYVAGYFNGTADFDPGSGTQNFTSAGSNDNFLVKLDADGNLVWARAFGNSDFEGILAMDVNSAGEPLVAGMYNGTLDVDPGAGEFLLTVSDPFSMGAFFVQFDSDGNLDWAVQCSGDGNTLPRGVTFDENDNLFATGTFGNSVDFDPGPGEEILTSVAFENGFVLKLEANGQFGWARHFASSESLFAYSVTVTLAGHVFTAGYHENTADFDPGTGVFELSPESTNALGAFVSRLDANGDFLGAQEFGGVNFVDYHGVGSDAKGNVYLTGAYEQMVDLNPTAGVEQQSTVINFRDNYLIKLSTVPTAMTEPEKARFRAFPNPTAGILQVQGIDLDAGKDYQLVDLTGRSVARGQFQSSNATLDLSGLHPGVYLLQLADGTSRSVVLN